MKKYISIFFLITTFLTSCTTKIPSKEIVWTTEEPITAEAEKTEPTSKPIPIVVYVTKSGKKYHTDHCTALSKSKIEINFEDAVKKNYTPCEKCKP